MELCNSRTKGTEELGNARSNRTEGVCTVNARIGLNWVMFQSIITCQRASTEAEHSANCIPDRRKVIFNDVVKELLGETPATHFLGTSNEMLGVDV